MATNTLNGYFSKPAVGGDTDTWGSTLNANWDTVDEILVGDSDIKALSIVSTTSTVPLICNAQSVTDIAATFSGHVGINETNPDTELHISAAFPKMLLQDTDGTDQYGELYHSNGTTALVARDGTTNGSIQLRRYDGTDVTTSMHIDTSGNVGIGTISPDSKLHVQSGGEAIRVNTTNENTHMSFGGTRAKFGYARIGASDLACIQGSTGKGIVFCTDNDTFGSGEKARITSSGNVGIGTIDPQRELEVTGTGNVYARITAPTDDDSAVLELKNTQETWQIRNQDTNDDALEFVDDTGTRLTIKKGGNVGIGTTNPDESLHIAGNLKVNGVIRGATFSNGTTADSTVSITSSDGYTSGLNIMGSNQGNGRLYVGQSALYGGGIEYCGDNDPTLSAGGADRIVLYRRDNNTDYWTARNQYSNNDWEFRGKVKANSLEGTLEASIFNQIYPLGCIYESTNSTSPATLFGGTWESYGSGRVLIGSGSYNDGTESKSFSAGSSSGKYNHTLTIAQMPSHRHKLGIPRDQYGVGDQHALTGTSNSDEATKYEHNSRYAGGSGSDANGNLTSAGTTQAHNNMQPYIVVYRWRRTGLS